jgi:hypothetical protein
MKKLAMVPMLTINKLVKALTAVRSASDSDKKSYRSPEANLGLIWVIANETLKEVAPEIENIMETAT